jgi:hypothetical protein
LKHEAFEDILKTVIQSNKKNFIAALQYFDWFKSSFAEAKNNQLLTNLLFSRNEYERAFAREFYLDENSSAFELDKTIIENMQEREFELACKEIILNNHSGKIFAKFFSAINNKLDDIANKEFQTFLGNEIYYQCVNYIKDCFSILEKLENKSS